MTATRDRRSDPDAANEDAPITWEERPVIGARRGLPWWGAVLLALGTAVVGAVLATLLTDGLGLPFQLIYLVGCLAAVAMVQRRNLFGPMVQPPLVMAVTVPVIVLTVSSLPESNDTLANVFAVSTPLINSFPVMAIATALTVALGVYRIYRERDPDLPSKNDKRGTKGSDKGDKGSAKGKSDKATADKAAADKARSGKGRSTSDSGSRDKAVKGAAAAGAAGVAGAAAAGALTPDERGGKDAPADRPRRPRPPEDQPDGPAGRGEPTRRKRPAGEPPARRPRGPEDGPPPRRPRPADAPPPGREAPPREGRRPRTPPDAAERKRRVEEWPDSIPGPKRPARPQRPQRPQRPRGEQPPPGERPPRRGQPPRRPWDDEA